MDAGTSARGTPGRPPVQGPTVSAGQPGLSPHFLSLDLLYYFPHLQTGNMVIMTEHSSLKSVYESVLKTSRNLIGKQSMSKRNSFY